MKSTENKLFYQIEGKYSIPINWTWVTIGELMKVVYRYPTYYGIHYTQHGIPEIRGELLLGNGEIERDLSKFRFISPETSNRFPKTQLKSGDIVISVRGTMGKIGIVRDNLNGANITANLIRLSPHNSIINSDFLKLFFLSNYFKTILYFSSSQTTIKTIRAPVLESITVPLPPLNEQKRIVTKLEELFTKLDAGIEYLKKNQILLKQYRQSILKYAFEGKITEKWRKKNIDESESPKLLLIRLSKSISGNNIQDNEIFFEDNEVNIPSSWILTKLKIIAQVNPRYNINLADNTEVSFLPMKCVKEETGHIDLSFTRLLKEVKKGYTPFIDNDIIFAKITPCMENGKIAIVNNLRNGIGFGSTEFHVIRLKDELPRKYYFYYLLQENLRKDAKRHMKGTAGQLRVPPMYIQDILIPFPSLKEQYAIINEIDRNLSVINNVESNIETCLLQKKYLRESILKNAFEGKLVPQDPNDESAGILLEKIKRDKESTISIKKEKSKITKKKSIDNDSKQMRLM